MQKNILIILKSFLFICIMFESCTNNNCKNSFEENDQISYNEYQMQYSQDENGEILDREHFKNESINRIDSTTNREHVKAESEAVDLGLPSGLKWAAGNVGAEKETDSGLYFAWGETEGFGAGGGRSFDKSHYMKNSVSENLSLAQDAANVRLGGDWRMPTKEECEELINECSVSWVTNYKDTGINGRLFVSKRNNNKIFIPASGRYYRLGLYDWNMYSFIWSSTFDSSSYGSCLYFNSYNLEYYHNYRYYGQTIRAVCE